MSISGEDAERKACRILRQEGYAIVERNWRGRFGEIDIIARDGDVLVFVEVKFRQGSAFGGPEAAVDPWKQKRIIATAREFLARTDCQLASRFDVVALCGQETRIYRHAFEVP